MARDIPLDKALSDEDRGYLRDRGAFGEALEKRVDAQYPPDPDAVAAFEARRKADAVNAPGDRELVEENARLREELAALKAAQGESGEAPAEDYSTWTNSALEAEIDRVNAEDSQAGLKKGNKADMAAALTDYFAA